MKVTKEIEVTKEMKSKALEYANKFGLAVNKMILYPVTRTVDGYVDQCLWLYRPTEDRYILFDYIDKDNILGNYYISNPDGEFNSYKNYKEIN